MSVYRCDQLEPERLVHKQKKQNKLKHREVEVRVWQEKGRCKNEEVKNKTKHKQDVSDFN